MSLEHALKQPNGSEPQTGKSVEFTVKLTPDQHSLVWSMMQRFGLPNELTAMVACVSILAEIYALRGDEYEIVLRHKLSGRLKPLTLP